MLDVLITGGTVIDGSNRPGYTADVGIRDGRIVAIGDLAGRKAARHHDARGRIVSPGFIDAHTHDDRLVLDAGEEACHPKLSQGVTTVVTGNCGISLAPLRWTDGAPPAPLDLLGRDGWTFERFGDYLDALARSRPTLNTACLVGHSTLRVRHVADLQKEADARECQRMAADLQEALKAGAIGLSTGLYYPPARAASTAEVIAVGAPLQRHGGIVAMHLRGEADQIDDALREGFEIGRALGVDTVLSHHKLIGKRNHGRSAQTLALIEEAAQAQSVCMDCYPYNASSTMLLAARVNQSSQVLVTWSEVDPSAAGRSLFALAQERGVSPESLVQTLSPAGAVYFAMDEGDVSRILAHPLTMVGSDGLARDRRLFPLETAVYKMTGLPARRFGLQGRGLLGEGCAADIAIFDAATIADRATFENPTAASVGMDAVFVNGVLACEQGRTVERHAGQVLRHGRTP
ncbi:MAG: D-aminoacylase [Paracidovorax wautersii]|uniref:D-aminoacylase n=1 Tax=Paracidovorax wautersii TaxID=1177982 RepID=A0A7V8JPN8_9BURK|nr:MAG: D-aminoacylase [Paracidovorax wautersii]